MASVALVALDRLLGGVVVMETKWLEILTVKEDRRSPVMGFDVVDDCRLGTYAEAQAEGAEGPLAEHLLAQHLPLSRVIHR